VNHGWLDLDAHGIRCSMWRPSDRDGIEQMQKGNPMYGVVLPETPEGFYVRTTMISPGTDAANTELARISREGGRVVAVVPFPEPSPLTRREVLVVFFWPLRKSEDS
jgi:hypothetical protein